MANPNPDKTIEPKILEAAKTEFYKKGYNDASLQLICANAGITTGAFYKRFKSKNALFTALFHSVTGDILNRTSNLFELYKKAEKSKSLEDTYFAITAEENFYLDIIFDYYDECKLLLCKGSGSELSELLDEKICKKVLDTHAFMEIILDRKIDFHLIDLILRQEVNTFCYILENNFNKAKAIDFLATVNSFYIAGWKSILLKA